MAMSTPQRCLPDKLFFKIGEVAELVGVRPHVLRYWEGEFGVFRPMKTRGSHRIYKRKDVELAMLIRRLLYDERYTIDGAKRRVRALSTDRTIAEPVGDAGREVRLRAELLGLRKDLNELLARFDEIGREQPGPRKTATIHAIVPSNVVVHRPAR